jgi:hypothetical protein
MTYNLKSLGTMKDGVVLYNVYKDDELWLAEVTYTQGYKAVSEVIQDEDFYKETAGKTNYHTCSGKIFKKD